MEVKQGQTVAITTGEYSDYCLEAHYTALKDFDTQAVTHQFLKERKAWMLLKQIPEDDYTHDDYDPNLHDHFLAWLTNSGYVDIHDNVVEWHIGSYGRLRN